MLFRVFRICIVVMSAAMLVLPAALDHKKKETEKLGDSRNNKELELRKKGAYEPFDEPDKAAEFYVRKRTLDQSGIPVEKYLKAIKHINRMPQHSTRGDRMFASQDEMSVAEAQPLALGTWTQLGPGNVGGRTRALTINPTNPNIMYAAGVAGGVWKTIDAGASWAPLADLLPNIAVSCLAMDPHDPNTLYAGTGEGYYNGDALRGAGIFKTTDAGSTWSILDADNDLGFRYVNDIVVSPIDGNRVYAATSTAVMRSLDGGTTWTYSVAINFPGFFDLAIRTDTTTDFVFATSGNVTLPGIVWRNPDAGGSGSWSPVLLEPNAGRISIAIAPSNQNIVYALVSELNQSVNPGPYQYGLHAVFRSTNSGENFSWVAVDRNTNPNKLNTVLLSNPIIAYLTECGEGTSQFFNQGWYDNVIAVDPVDSNRVWAGGIDLFRSDDGGANWGLASYWWEDSSAPQYAHADQHAIVFHPQYNGASNQTMFVAGDGGIFKTANARGPVATGSGAPCNSALSGVSWASLNNNYGVTQFYNVAPYPNGTTYFGRTQDNGTVRGGSSGINGWTEILGGDGGFVAVNPTNTNILYAENTGLSIKKSTNGGISFASSTSGITESSSNFLFIAPFAMNPKSPLQLYTGGSYIWRSTNGGTSWTRATSYPNFNVAY
ncbi:MAG: hypothetical protein DMF60_11160, partial [Acidobacteria bacterium]